MTDAILTEPRQPGEIVPETAYTPRRVHSPRPLPQKTARAFFADQRQRKVAEDLQGVILWGGLISLLTLTIYRFWMKTEQRRLIWRETRLDDDGFEYTGTPLELLIGSMIAIVILAIWFGLANLGLSYLQLAAWNSHQFTVLIAPIVVAPLAAFAVYRARRYRMLRTKWRGIRCGMDGSGLKYTGRWLLWSIAQVLTLGFITPFKRLALERYMTTHMLYGDARFRFEPPEGAGTHLLKHWMLPWLAGLAMVALVFLAVEGFPEKLAQIGERAMNDELTQVEVYGMLFLAAGPLLLLYVLYLRYKSREIGTVLSSRKLLGAWCESHLTWGTTFKPALAYVGYWLLLIIPVLMALSVGLWLLLAIGMIIDGKTFADLTGAGGPPTNLFSSFGAKVAAYGGLYLFYGGTILFSLWLGALIHFRRLHTYICRGTVVHNIQSLNTVRQRIKDDQIESEGFADALDVGGI